MTPRTRQCLEQAAAALRQGELASAATLCERVLGETGATVDALSLLALVRKRQGDAPAAEALMKQALAIDPRRADIRANLANLYLARGRREEALAEYRRALEASPGFRTARLGLARALLDGGRATEALAEARELAAADPDDAEAWNVAGSASRLLDRQADAEDAFRRALDAAPGYAVARHNLGALLAGQSRSEEALAELDAALAAGVVGPEISHNRAAVLMALGRLDEAEATLGSALSDRPGAVSLQLLLARIRYMRGDPAFADAIGRAVDADPANAALRVAQARILCAAGRLDAAVESIERGLLRAADDPRLLAEKSALLLERGEYREALSVARRAALRAPGEAALEDLRIRALLSLGSAGEAQELIRAARRRAPLNQYYIALEATAARLLGDPRYEWLYDFDRLVQSFELPVPAGWASIDAYHRELVEVLKERHRFVAPPLDQSLRSGTQTPRGLLNDPDPRIGAFLEAIREPIARYRERIGGDAEHPLSERNRGDTRLAGCWSVRLTRNGYHVNHVHSEGWISSAYYVDVPAEVRDTEARSGWLKFGEPPFFVPGAEPEKLVQPRPGLLVLFPSYMWHGTTPIRGDEPRLTIAFDAVPAQ